MTHMYQSLDLSQAVLIRAETLHPTEKKAIRILIDEIEKRTGISLQDGHTWPEHANPAIVVGNESLLNDLSAPYRECIHALPQPGKEGYRICSTHMEDTPVVFVIGNDPRGVLYGIGRLLRNLRLSQHSVKLDANFRISGTPAYPLRGHQLGYRPKNNTYDAWSIEQFDQYIRELALFGANCIEILPPRTDDEALAPVMKADPMEMMVQLCDVIDSYGLDVWLWYPNMFTNEDYHNPDRLQQEIDEREEIFKTLKRIDQIMIPGGDPGKLDPAILFEWSATVATLLHTYHPEAKLWISPQTSTPTDAWLNAFYGEVNKEPEWLGGIVFGPGEKASLPELREIIPEKYPIRHYPDISHSLHCQYPVPDWDVAFALTLGRECMNPRPKAFKYIHNVYESYTIGAITYSEGIHDDVNKFVWADQDWNPQTPVIETLRDYSRLFISQQYGEELAQAFGALEENWEGPLAINDRVELTFRQWHDLEQRVPETVADNYRFQMGLLRAYYDLYIKRRLLHERELEAETMEILRQAESLGATAAISQAREVLQRKETAPVARDLRQRCVELTDELFEHIGIQLTVKKHHAISWRRGAFMDGIDVPLNDAAWLFLQFDRIEAFHQEAEKIAALQSILNRANPGPGGFYDNFGAPRSKQRVKNLLAWKDDPGNLKTPFFNFNLNAMKFFYRHTDETLTGVETVPFSRIKHVSTMYDLPLTIAYENLDPASSYTLRVTYVPSRRGESNIRLIANGKYVIHDYRKITSDTSGIQAFMEFPISQEALQEGKLELTWTIQEGDPGVGVAEVWIMKEG